MSVARADLRISSPTGEQAWELIPHVLGRVRQGIKAVDGKLTGRAAAKGTAAFSVQLDNHPVMLICGYDPTVRALVLRIETESSGPVRLAALAFPTVLLVVLVAVWFLQPHPVAIALGFVVGILLATLTSWAVWSAARRRGVEGAGTHRVVLANARSSQLAALRGAGLEVEEIPSRLLGLEEQGMPASASETEEEALLLGDPRVWTRRLHAALEALP